MYSSTPYIQYFNMRRVCTRTEVESYGRDQLAQG